jgi:virginiamycin B lyase
MSKRALLGFLGFVVFVLIGVSTLEAQQTPPASSSDYLYWGDFWYNAIGRAKLDGTEVTPFFISGLKGPVGVAVNGQYLYWTNFGDGEGNLWSGTTISRANWDGTNVIPAFISGCKGPWGLAIDDQFLYWTNATDTTIGRARLDGTEVNQSFIVPSYWPREIVAFGGYLYWGNAVGVARAKTDGTGLENDWITVAVSSPHGVAVTDTHVYWTNYADGSIGRANIDGTEPGLWQPLAAGNVTGIETKGDYLYWGRWGGGGIGRGSLGGADFDPFWISGVGTTATLALVHEASMSAFAVDQAKIDFKKKPDSDKVRLKGDFSLAAGAAVSIADSVTAAVGAYSWTISMEEKANGTKWEYRRPQGKDGGIKSMTIDWSGGAASFDLRVDSADIGDMASWLNPVTISLKIGQIKGAQAVTMREKNNSWEYKK